MEIWGNIHVPTILTLSLTHKKARAQHLSRGTTASNWDCSPGNLIEAVGLKGCGTPSVLPWS